MLRVYSVLYMERLWNHSPSSVFKQVDHSESTSILSEVLVVPAITTATTATSAVPAAVTTAIPAAATAPAINNDYGATSRSIIDVDQEEHQVQEVEVPEVIQEPVRTQLAEYTSEEIEIDTGALKDIDEEDEEEDDKEEEKSDSSSEDYDKYSMEESEGDQIVSRLAIDTNKIHPQDQTEEFTATTATDHPTSISSSSSIVPPLTPSSIHSVHNHSDITEQNPQKRPRNTSLIRRETNKFNDRRKSLTLKLKRALTVKTENKRASV